MKHPSEEQWISLFYGELSKSESDELHAHLGTCPECRHQWSWWQRVGENLDRDAQFFTSPVQTIHPPSSKSSRSWWAAAAAIVFGLGVLIGQTNRTDTREMKAALLPQLKEELAHEIQAHWNEEVRPDLLVQLEQANAATLRAATRFAQEQTSGLAEAWNEARALDQATFLSLLENLELNRQENMAQLRQDLETVAVVTESKLLATQDELHRIASFDRPLSTTNN